MTTPDRLAALRQQTDQHTVCVRLTSTEAAEWSRAVFVSRRVREAPDLAAFSWSPERECWVFTAVLGGDVYDVRLRERADGPRAPVWYPRSARPVESRPAPVGDTLPAWDWLGDTPPPHYAAPEGGR